MFFHRILFFFPFLLLGASCSQVSYLWDQGKGQLKLLSQARENQEVLADESVPPRAKSKIQKVMEYKKFFYSYFDLKESGIYSKTTLLEDEAVTYLVILSPVNEIQAYWHDFPLVGSFPYLGFFEKDKALQYAKKMEKEGWVSYMRPVYAYSTLGHFEDPILSSFFEFNDIELAELVFHELFHTIFFAKDEIEVNESLADFFAEQLTVQYFSKGQNSKAMLLEIQENKIKQHGLSEKILQLALELNQSYKNKNPQEDPSLILKDFLKHRFVPQMAQLCTEYSMTTCRPIEEEWNNARFAGFLTYEKEASFLESLFRQEKLDLKEFYHYIWSMYREYRNGPERQQRNFADHLRGKIHGPLVFH